MTTRTHNANNTKNITLTNAGLKTLLGNDLAAAVREAGEWVTPFGSLTRLRGAVWTVEGSSPATTDALVKWLKAGEPLTPALFRMQNEYRGYRITVAPVTLLFDNWVAGAAPLSGTKAQGRTATGGTFHRAAMAVKSKVDRHLGSGDRGQGKAAG